MNNGRDRHDLVFNPINDSVTVSEPLANILIAEFWYYSTGKRESRELSSGGKDCLDNCGCVGGGIRSYVLSDGFEVFNSPTLLGKPFPKSLLNVFMGNGSLRLSRLEAIPNFFDDIEVILNILERAIVR